MRILMISDVYFPRINGVSTSIQTFHRELVALDHEVHIIAPMYPTDKTESRDITRIASRYLLLDPEDRLMKFGDIMALLPELKIRNFDLIHIQTPFVAHYAGTKLARELGIPCVETYHTFFEEYLHHYIQLLPKALTRHATRAFSRSQCNAVDAIIVPSTAMSRVLTQYGITTPLHIAPTGIPLNTFKDGDGKRFRLKHGIPQNRPILLHVGRVAHEKNMGFLLEVMAHLKPQRPDILFVICGEGPAQKSLRRQALKLGLADQVKFIGYLDRETELQDCYRSADIFIFASRTETQGLVLLEAMALGVPLVSTAMMGTIDILSAGKGALVAEENVADFAQKTLRLLDDNALRIATGEAGREYAKSWTAPVTATRLVEVYEILLKNSTGQLQVKPELVSAG